MAKLHFALIVLAASVASLAGCAKSGTSTGPDTAADEATEDSDLEGDAEASTPEEAGDEAADEGTNDTEGDDEGGEAAEGEAAEPPPVKKTCAELPEGTCKITSGCAWSSDKKCLDQ